jgi:aryl-phospho-beta-D-glucosidase BglC (GH1 family)
MRTLLTLFTFLSFQFHLFAQTPIQTNGSLSVVGSEIVNQHGQTVSFAGTSLFWSNTGWGGESFYNSSTISWLKNDWDISIVRAAMGVEDNGGYISDAINNKARVRTVVDAAINEGIYVIIDWHSHHAENYEVEAIAFFEEMATLYGQYDNIIYEIYNEPLQISWDNVIKPYADSVVAAIRAIDSSNLIIVGTPSWSQDVDVASMNPIVGYPNIAYTLHFYAATHGQSLRNKATTALNNGIALMVTEWGTVSANGNGAVDVSSTNDWMTFLCDNNLSHCNWAINDKVEGASALISGTSNLGNWSASDLTTSGTLVKGIIEDWQLNCVDTTIVAIETLNKATLEVTGLFPNPINKKQLLSLRINAPSSQVIQIYWHNTLGVLLSQKNTRISKGVSILEIETPDVPKGLYFITIETQKGKQTKSVSVE